MKHLWLISFALLVLSCDDKEETVDCNIKATLKDYTGVDGCKFVLVLENGEVLEMGDFINHKSKYDIITANNDVLNHLKQSVGLDATFSHIYNMLNDDGIFFSDAVSSFDILNNWENCNHILSDNKSFKCEISHKVTDRSLPIGEMYRNWSFKIGKQWLHKKVEIERVIGISPDELMVSSKINNFLPKLFNWHLDKNIEDDTSRIGILLKKK